jgi:hypothetical protein
MGIGFEAKKAFQSAYGERKTEVTSLKTDKHVETPQTKNGVGKSVSVNLPRSSERTLNKPVSHAADIDRKNTFGHIENHKLEFNKHADIASAHDLIAKIQDNSEGGTIGKDRAV